MAGWVAEWPPPVSPVPAPSAFLRFQILIHSGWQTLPLVLLLRVLLGLGEWLPETEPQDDCVCSADVLSVWLPGADCWRQQRGLGVTVWPVRVTVHPTGLGTRTQRAVNAVCPALSRPGDSVCR